MTGIFCIVLGYLAGTLNPAALISKIKKKSLRDVGTGNLGATNTLLTFGKSAGLLVMLFDIAKAFLIYRLTRRLLPTLKIIALLAGLAVILGHCFPFYMGFKGGKGLAAFAGVVLGYSPSLFLFLLISGVALMIAVNYSFALPFYAASFFAIAVSLHEGSLAMAVVAIAIAVFIIAMHFGNFLRVLRGEERKIRPYIKEKLFR